VKRLVLFLAALFGGALLFAGSASAHATLVASSPTDGARLSTAPSSVTLTFDEQVGIGGLGYLHVTDPAGRRVESAVATHPGGDGTKVSVPLKSGLGDGTYTGSYRVVSADSHPIAGVVRFVVGTGPLTSTPVDTGTSDAGVAAVFDASRWISWTGLALLGGAWLLLTVWPAGRDDRRARRLVWTGWGLAVLGTLLELLLQGAYGAGESLISAVKPTLIDATLHGDYGQLHSARLLLLGALAVVLGYALQPARLRSRLDDAFWPLGVGLAYTFSAVGHATTTSPAWLSIAADTLHLCAMATWVGGLVIVVFALLPRREPDELHEALPVFSRVAFISVVTLAVTGTYAAWRGIGSWRALFHTEYGLLVMAKVLLFFGLLALGNLSRTVIQKRVRRPVVAYAMTSSVSVSVSDEPSLDQVATERMRRSVLVEIAVAAIVLGVTSVLVSQPRGAESLATQDRASVSAVAKLDGARTATVLVTPGVHGTVGVDVTLSAGAGAKPKSVTGTATEPAQQLGPIPLKLAADGKNRYSASGVDLPVAGTWVIALVVTESQFDAVTTDVKIVLK
jgi:copper transport protein